MAFQLKNGKWREVAQVKDQYGKSRPLMKEGKTAKEAEDKLRKALAAYIPSIPTPKTTVDEGCAIYLERCKTKGRKAKTIEDYRKYKDGVVKRTIGHKKAALVTAHDIDAMLEEIKGKVARQRCREFLRAVWNKVFLKGGICVTNAPALSDAPEHSPSRKAKLTPANFKRILTKESDPIRKALWLVFADSGYRPFEIRTLKWSELRRQDDGIWIVKEDAKTDEGKKPRPLTKAAAEALFSLPSTSPVYVFPSNRTGVPWNERTIRDWWTQAQEAVTGIPITDLYELRHFFGSRMARVVKDDVLKRLMGHKDVRTSKQYYVEPFEEDLRAAVEEL